MVQPAIHADLRDEFSAIAAEIDCEIFDISFEGKALRITLDRIDGTVTLQDCTAVSRQVSALLDVHDFGRDRYTLEVSSPGLDRPLRDAKDYRRFVGGLSRLTYVLDDAEGNRTSRTVTGRIEAFDEESGGTVVLREHEDDSPVRIGLGAIRRARLEPEI